MNQKRKAILKRNKKARKPKKSIKNQFNFLRKNILYKKIPNFSLVYDEIVYKPLEITITNHIFLKSEFNSLQNSVFRLF